jgi:hypothetical protein
MMGIRRCAGEEVDPMVRQPRRRRTLWFLENVGVLEDQALQ